MTRAILIFITSFIVFSSVVGAVSAQVPERYATCDACGFCINSRDKNLWQGSITPPAKWPDCQKCLYPEANPDPFSGQTLLIDPVENVPPTPALGRQYTVFSCVKTDLADFTQSGAASSLVQVLLNVIFTTAGGIALLYIIYGSFLIITSQGDSERLAYGKRVVTGAIIGLILSLSTVFVVNLIASGVLKLPGFGKSSI